jgi:hypothetical protein
MMEIGTQEQRGKGDFPKLDELRRIKRAILVEVGTRGALCLSRFAMEVEAPMELLRDAAKSLVEQGRIRPVHGLRETYEGV